MSVNTTDDIRARITEIISQGNPSRVLNLKYIMEHRGDLSLVDLLQNIDSNTILSQYISLAIASSLNIPGVAEIEARQYILKSEANSMDSLSQPNDIIIEQIDSFFKLKDASIFDVPALYPERNFEDPQAVEDLLTLTKSEIIQYREFYKQILHTTQATNEKLDRYLKRITSEREGLVLRKSNKRMLLDKQRINKLFTQTDRLYQQSVQEAQSIKWCRDSIAMSIAIIDYCEKRLELH